MPPRLLLNRAWWAEPARRLIPLVARSRFLRETGARGLARFVFGIGSVVMQESIVYMHATLFLVVAGYTLLRNGHVRCDIFYADATPKQRALVDIFGVFVFLLPMCALIAWTAWPYVASAWSVYEGSPEGGLGIPGVYLLKSTMLVFVVLVALQGLSLAVHSLSLLLGIETKPGAHEASGGTQE